MGKGRHKDKKDENEKMKKGMKERENGTGKFLRD